jgi:glycosidase
MLSALLPFLLVLASSHQTADRIPFEFRYLSPSTGHEVSVAGDFNGWNKSANPMKADVGGRLFRLKVPLTYGRHEYKFVLDGETWIVDPANPKLRDDGNGNKNSYVIVLPPDYDAPAALGDGKITLSGLEHRQVLPELNFDQGELQLGFRTRSNDVQSVKIILASGSSLSMESLSSDELFAHWRVDFPWNRKSDLDYCFKLEDGGAPIYFGPHGPSSTPEGNRFHLSAATFKPFEVPRWVQNSVVYQIFPDRFANGDPTNDGPKVEPWGGAPTFANRFGGDLAGVGQHLDYLKSLGVGCVYFNPLFEGPSNHGYETNDYLQIDRRLGSNSEFGALVKDFRKNGIRTVLDGVFNHTARGFFAFKDVVQNESRSPYLHWYFFHGFPVKTEGTPNYEAWFGFASLPKLNHSNPEVRDYLLGIPTYWEGVAPLGGWRLDAANEVPDDYWREFRKRVKGLDPEQWICGEIWGDASHWLQGDMFDSTMNYRFRDAILGFLSPNGDAKPSTFWNSLMTTFGLYPPQVDRNLMNVIDSHDTERILTEVGHDRKLADLAAILQFTWVGTPSIYYGDEVGLDGGKDPDNRRCMPWQEVTDQNPVLKLYRRLAAIRNSSPELQAGVPRLLVEDDAKGVLGFARTTRDERAHERSVIVLTNRSSDPRTVFLAKALLRGESLRDALTGRSLTVREESGGSSSIEIPAKSAIILQPSK